MSVLSVLASTRERSSDEAVGARTMGSTKVLLSHWTSSMVRFAGSELTAGNRPATPLGFVTKTGGCPKKDADASSPGRFPFNEGKKWRARNWSDMTINCLLFPVSISSQAGCYVF